jgi:hypothetical protein
MVRRFEFCFGCDGGRITTVRVILCGQRAWKEQPEYQTPLWGYQRFGRFVLAVAVGSTVPPAAETDSRVRFMQPVKFSAN